MTEREKIINIVGQNKYCGVDTANALIEAGFRDITTRGWIFMNGEAIVPTPDIYNKVAELLDCPKIEEGVDND